MVWSFSITLSIICNRMPFCTYELRGEKENWLLHLQVTQLKFAHFSGELFAENTLIWCYFGQFAIIFGAVIFNI